MKTYLLKFGLFSSCIMIALSAAAGPLRRSDVAADPNWLVHLDCDGLRPTALGQFILGELNKPEAQAKLAAFQALVNFDLRTQLHGLTLYSLGSSPKEGVLLVYADFDPDRLVTLAQAAKDSQSTTYKDSTIYNWVDEKKAARQGGSPRTYAAIQGKRVVFGQNEGSVEKALDVLTGASANLASGKAFPALGAPSNANFLQAAASKMDFVQDNPQAQVLKLSKQVMLQVGEAQSQLSAALTLQANDEEVANNINSIMNGLISLLKLQKEKPESVKLAQGLALRQEGPVVHLNLTLPTAEAIQIAKTHEAKKAHKKEAKEE